METIFLNVVEPGFVYMFCEIRQCCKVIMCILNVYVRMTV